MASPETQGCDGGKTILASGKDLDAKISSNEYTRNSEEHEQLKQVMPELVSSGFTIGRG